MPTITSSVAIAAKPSTVWSLLTTTEGLRQWFAPTAEFESRIGGAHRHISPGTEQLITGTVLEMVPEKLLVLSWYEEDEPRDWVHPIRCTFSLEAVAGGTQVTMVFDGFPGIGKATWEKTYQAYQKGVERHDLLGHLKQTVECHVA